MCVHNNRGLDHRISITQYQSLSHEERERERERERENRKMLRDEPVTTHSLLTETRMSGRVIIIAIHSLYHTPSIGQVCCTSVTVYT